MLLRKFSIVQFFFIILFVLLTVFAYKAYAITNTSCANTSGGCCGGTDKDAYDSKNGLKITTAPQITCSGTTCSAKISMGGTYNAIVWAGPGACTSTGYCYKRPTGTTYTITGLQQGKTYGVKVSTSNSSGGIVSGYGVEYPGGSCNYKLIAAVPAPATPTPTHGPTPTPTHGPTPTPGGPTPTPTSTPQATINLPIQLSGIGAGGNLEPKHPSRTGLHVSLYKATDDPTQPNVAPVYDNKNLPLTYQSNTGYFTNSTIHLGSVPTGDYQLLVKLPGYLRKQFADSSGGKTIHLTQGQTTAVPVMQLVPGDTAPIYNIVGPADFYAIADCYKDKASTSTCAAGSQITDLNDDGVVDGVDLNIWLRGYQALVANSTPGDGGQIPGDGVAGD